VSDKQFQPVPDWFWGAIHAALNMHGRVWSPDENEAVDRLFKMITDAGLVLVTTRGAYEKCPRCEQP